MTDTDEGAASNERTRSALVTGCATQPGAAIARQLDTEGWRVVVTARSEGDLTEWEEAGYETASLDLADPEEPAAVLEEGIEETGSLEALINAHARRQPGAIEDVPPRLVRRQFEATLLGFHRLVRAALPHMRESGTGRIVTITGVSGRLSPPGGGIDASSQVAVEALQDALRAEVRPHGVDVVTIQPGPIEGQSLAGEADELERSAAYEDVYEFYDEVGLVRGLATTTPDEVARVVHQAVTCADPAPRYPVGRVAAITRWARFLPDSVRDSLYSIARRLP
jgi:NAD(P)-dependent dehydrogenase (short-subunit alcohol dehydrogenase family)